MLEEAVQISLDHGVSLSRVEFVVVDLETTGGSPVEDAITEIGAVRYRGGERIGSFQTLVDPLRPIPPYVANLTGIDERLVAGEPTVAHVLPSFLEFVRGAIFVAHNARFDFSFLNANLDRLDYPLLPGPIVCTAKLARRVVWPDVPNVRLRTLATYFRTRAQPSHRAFADAEACGEVLNGLLDLGERLGITTLGDLLHACTARGRPNFGKIRLAESLPRTAGVYLFRGRDGRVLYVGKAKDLRARVKSYFYGDGRKKVQDLLDSTSTVDGIPTPGGELEALALEARLIAANEPRFNSRGKQWRRAAYLKLDVGEAWPRWKIVSRASDQGVYLGPFSARARARLAQEALEEAFPIRRCTRSMGARTRFAPCALADMRRCLAPCDGRTDLERYGELVGRVLSSLSSPGELLATLERRIGALAEQERYEEAALARDRLQALVEALWRARFDRWLTAGRLVLRGPTGAIIAIDNGSVVCARQSDPGPIGSPPQRERADELAAVRSWLAHHPCTLTGAEVALAEPVGGGRELADVRARLRSATRD